MQIHLCDICKEVINSSKYYIVIAKENEKQEEDSLQPNYGTNVLGAYESAMRQYSKYKQNLKSYEICEKCKETFDYLLSLRKKELDKLKQKSNKIIKEEGLWEI
jgi:hypothetical protein